jgi:hypothetical protein
MRRLSEPPANGDGKSWDFPAMGALPIASLSQDTIPLVRDREVCEVATKQQRNDSGTTTEPQRDVVTLSFYCVSVVVPLSFYCASVVVPLSFRCGSVVV